MKPAIAFDLDGTLVDVSKRDYRIYEDIIKNMGGVPIPYIDYWPMRRAKTDIHLILSQSGIEKEEDVDFFLFERKVRMEQPVYLQIDHLFDDVIETLCALSKVYDIYILTIRHNRKNTEEQLKQLELDKYHTIIVDAHKEDAMKHIPNLLAMAGDTENDIIPALSLGLKAIAVTTGIRNESQLRGMNPTYIVKSLKDVKCIL